MNNIVTKVKNFATLDLFLLIFFWAIFNMLYWQVGAIPVSNNKLKLEKVVERQANFSDQG